MTAVAGYGPATAPGRDRPRRPLRLLGGKCPHFQGIGASLTLMRTATSGEGCMVGAFKAVLGKA
jgi:hypothetical protein